MILVSACLAGIRCRYDGTATAETSITDLVNKGKAIAVCPEILGNLTTPRSCCEIDSSAKQLLIKNQSDEDLTPAFIQGAKLTLELCKRENIHQAILQQRSPSCGCGMIYDGSFTGKLIKGDGITTQILKANGITVIPFEKKMVQATL